MKIRNLWSLICAISIISLASCGQNGKGINDIKIGRNTESNMFVGQPNLVEADIEVDEPIEEIYVELKAKTDDGSELIREVYDGEGIEGLSKLGFTENFAIPLETKPGTYILTIKVKQSDGSIVEESVETVLSVDSTVPVASALDVGLNAKGNDLHLETDISAAKKIQQIVVKIVGESWSKDFTFDGPNVKDKVSYTFHEHVHIDDAPAGDYHVVLIVQDQDGREGMVEGDFKK